MKRMKTAVCAMAAALCAGMFLPATAEAADRTEPVKQEEIVGTWLGGPPTGATTFSEDGYADDGWNSRAYHMENDTVTLTYYDGSTTTVGYDLWRGETKPSELKKGEDACVYWLKDDNTLVCWNISKRTDDDTIFSYAPSESVREGSQSGQEASCGQPAKQPGDTAEAKAAAQMAQEASRLGFQNMVDMQLAQAAGKSAGEYYNNAVINTEGIEGEVPVAQGGGLIIDGKETNATAMISKVSSFYVNSVRAAREGTVLNVVKVTFPAKAAVVNFYMPGVVQGDAVTAAQYVDGAWTDVEVTEVRNDHVVLNLQNNGVVAFLKN